MKRKIAFIILGSYLICHAACIGVGVPSLVQKPPISLIRGGDQIGRDVLANRMLVATKAFPITDMHKNEVITILGEPSYIRVTERNVSEDWHYTYYKRYKTWPKTEKDVFLIRFYNDKVIDVVKG
jgi:hypothetical protein